jgi:hypothetical protein
MDSKVIIKSFYFFSFLGCSLTERSEHQSHIQNQRQQKTMGLSNQATLNNNVVTVFIEFYFLLIKKIYFDNKRI